VSRFLAGGLLGAVVQAPISNRFGRRIATGSGAILAVISGALQAGSVHVAMFIVARLLCGISCGILMSNCPVYMSEISPPHIRGLLVSNHAISIVSSYIFSSLMALAFHYVDEPYQWRLQFVLLTFFGLVLLVSLAFLPESPRWLCQKERYNEARMVLQRLHQSPDDPDSHLAVAEMAQIKAHIETERALPRGYIYIFRTPHLRHRAACSILMWVMAQSTGILVIANLTPTLFGQLGLGVVLQLGLSATTWICSMLGCFVNALLMDRVGRVKLLSKNPVWCTSSLPGERPQSPWKRR
jgi:MFS family permease